jgi:hypothetical protein
MIYRRHSFFVHGLLLIRLLLVLRSRNIHAPAYPSPEVSSRGRSTYGNGDERVISPYAKPGREDLETEVNKGKGHEGQRHAQVHERPKKKEYPRRELIRDGARVLLRGLPGGAEHLSKNASLVHTGEWHIEGGHRAILTGLDL